MIFSLLKRTFFNIIKQDSNLCVGIFLYSIEYLLDEQNQVIKKTEEIKFNGIFEILSKNNYYIINDIWKIRKCTDNGYEIVLQDVKDPLCGYNDIYESFLFDLLDSYVLYFVINPIDEKVRIYNFCDIKDVNGIVVNINEVILTSARCYVKNMILHYRIDNKIHREISYNRNLDKLC